MPPNTPLNGFGNNTFNTPSLIEAADTLPFFHTNTFGRSRTQPTSRTWCRSTPIASSSTRPRRASWTRGSAAPSNVAPDIDAIGRFLRALNVAFNLDIAKQRLRAAQTHLQPLPRQRKDIQIELISWRGRDRRRARGADAARPSQPFYPSPSIAWAWPRPRSRRRSRPRRRHRAGAALERHLAHRERPRPDRRQHHLHPRCRQPVLLIAAMKRWPRSWVRTVGVATAAGR